MQFFQIIVLASLATVGLTTSIPVKRSLASVPKCARNCLFGPVIASRCSNNVACLCQNQKLQNAVTTCIPKACGRSDASKIIGLANQYCRGVRGFPLAMP
ncbi:hypothetical protein BZA77DRAFT_328348 [Pyronema omphalodes]|nr:hypothetical protein BZA77DRAFT_328348 [Pyronema omphalodes]